MDIGLTLSACRACSRLNTLAVELCKRISGAQFEERAVWSCATGATGRPATRLCMLVSDGSAMASYPMPVPCIAYSAQRARTNRMPSVRQFNGPPAAGSGGEVHRQQAPAYSCCCSRRVAHLAHDLPVQLARVQQREVGHERGQRLARDGLRDGDDSAYALLVHLDDVRRGRAHGRAAARRGGVRGGPVRCQRTRGKRARAVARQHSERYQSTSRAFRLLTIVWSALCLLACFVAGGTSPCPM